ncbi:MAG: hypothetical protein N3F10_03860 [Candidatus Bathyarchaeota archaeon]|nr:hypothetical protein [Candidatus Bathyarchaeota archaeon]MCX8177415.1 hypothetical protein [Candidatus Bathyarchaeota archaeon]
MKPVGGRYRLNFLHKVRVASRLVRKDTQSLRVKLLDEVEAMFQIAKQDDNREKKRVALQLCWL